MKEGLPDTWGVSLHTGRAQPLNQGSQLQAVIFDFDLTLADSTKAAAACIAYALESLGFEEVPEGSVRKTIGLSLEATLENLTGNTDPEIQTQFKDLFVQHADLVMVGQTEFLEGAHTALLALRDLGLRLAVVSTKYRYRIEAILDRLEGEDLFDVVIGGEDVRAHKPDPEGLRLALQKLEVGAAESIYVGDHVVDAQAAMKVPISFVPVLTGATDRGAFLALPHLKILGSVSELPSFISQFKAWHPSGANTPLPS